MSTFEEILAQVKAEQARLTADEATPKMDLPSHPHKEKQDAGARSHGGLVQRGGSDVEQDDREETSPGRSSDTAKRAPELGLLQHEDSAGQMEEGPESADEARGSLELFPVPASFDPQVEQQGVELTGSTAMARSTHRTRVRAADQTGQRSRSTHGEPVVFTPGVAFAHRSEETAVKRFPKVLVDRLRSLVGSQISQDFAKECSAAQLLTAFVLTQLGVELEGLDENTAKVVSAFHSMEPRIGALEDGLTEIDQQMHQMEARLSDAAGLLKVIEKVGGTMELGLSYLIADRIIPFRTQGMTTGNAEIDHPRTLAMRETLRRQAEAQRNLQRQRDGRPY